jgi:hypothetical protein
METTTSSLIQRLMMLGLKCDEVPRDHPSSAITALAVFPMYMVANVHGWTTDRQFKVPLVDIPGSEAIREAFAIGKAEANLPMSREHRHVLGTLLTHAKPSDQVIYEYALETLAQFLGQAEPALADVIRTGVARTIVAVARASGEGFLGKGPKVSPEERACISRIGTVLNLASTPAAVAALAALDALDA